MVEATGNPFYTDWTFWAVVVSFVAIILSQLPPLHILLRPRKILVEVHNRASITHKVGNPNLLLFIGLTNIGGRRLKIQQLQISIRREGKEISTAYAKAYLTTNNGTTTPSIFFPFSLNPEETWAFPVSFYNDFDKSTEIKFKKCEAALREDINSKLNRLPEGLKHPVSAAPEYVKPFLDIFSKYFIWEPGEYTLKLSPITIPKTKYCEKSLRFTIYESDTEFLRKQIEDYQIGAGIYYDSNTPTVFAVELSEQKP